MRLPCLALALAAAVACSPGVEGPPPLQQADTNGYTGTSGFHPRRGDVLVLGMNALRVNGAATLDGVRLDLAHGEVELLDARVSDGNATGSYCGTTWPPAGYGGSVPVSGYQVRPGDEPALVLYFRQRTEAARTGAVVLAYRDEDGDRRELRIDNDGFEVAPKGPDDPPMNCSGSRWLT